MSECFRALNWIESTPGMFQLVNGSIHSRSIFDDLPSLRRKTLVHSAVEPNSDSCSFSSQFLLYTAAFLRIRILHTRATTLGDQWPNVFIAQPLVSTFSVGRIRLLPAWIPSWVLVRPRHWTALSTHCCSQHIPREGNQLLDRTHAIWAGNEDQTPWDWCHAHWCHRHLLCLSSMFLNNFHRLINH